MREYEYEVTFKVKIEAENADDAAKWSLAILSPLGGGGTAEVEVRRSMGGGAKRVVAYASIFRGAWAWTHRAENP